MSLPWRIAVRYLFSKKSHNVINVISMVSAVGLAIGSAALVLILSVYNGFNNVIEENMSEMDPDILLVRDDGKMFVPGDETAELLRSPEVARTGKVLEFNVYARYDGRQGAARLRGLEDMPHTLTGMAFSYRMGINPHLSEPLELYFPDRKRGFSAVNPSSSLRMEKVYPFDRVNFGSELDAKMVAVPLEVATSLYGDECVSGIEICLKDGSPSSIRKFIDSHGVPGFVLLDEHMQHPELYRMMKLEKAAVFLILLLVVLIVALNVYGSLSMLVMEKKGDIATLRAMGATDGTIRRIFLFEGWLISLAGMAAGLVVGLVLALLQQKFGIVKMPGNFLVSAYPVSVQIKDLVLTAAGIGLIGLVIAFFPSKKSIS